jgi:adenylate cyclase
VTVAFADVAGFTRLGEASPPEELENVASRLTELAHDVAGGPVRFIKSIGDAVMFVCADAAPSWMPCWTSLRVPTRMACPA